MRRALILALLLGGIELILPLGSFGQGSQALLTFGFLILAAYTVGEIATSFKLPKIVGYLVAGVIFGPSVLNVVSYDGAQRLEGVNQLAIALIAFLAGAELRWAEVREHGTKLLKLMATELGVTFVVLAATVYGIGTFFDIIPDPTSNRVLAFALLFAAIAIVHSPAVTMALLTETRARGPVARTTLGVVLLSDVAVVLFFTLMLWVARALVPLDGAAANPWLVAWEIGGALLVGVVIGLGVAAYLRFVGRELMLFAVLMTFFGLELTQVLHVELLLSLLVAGFVAENISEHGERLRHAMERSAAPVFVVFFALSGAKIGLREVLPLLPFVIPIAIARALSIRAGMSLGGRWAGATEEERKYAWMGLVSQAGVAIGLAAIVAQAYPQLGAQLRSMLLALIAVNETVGPILFRRALAGSGEIQTVGAAAAARVKAAGEGGEGGGPGTGRGGAAAEPA
jgi:Kef-type K+ transport system membrane component KefB